MISEMSPPQKTRFDYLFDDAKMRNYRKEHVYIPPEDQECTFKPKLFARKKSNLLSPPQKDISKRHKSCEKVVVYSPMGSIQKGCLRTSSKKRYNSTHTENRSIIIEEEPRGNLPSPLTKESRKESRERFKQSLLHTD